MPESVGAESVGAESVGDPHGVGAVDLAAGGSLPGAFGVAWRRDPTHRVLSTLDGEILTAAVLDERTATAAGRYAAAGLTPGDRVLLCAQNSLDLVVSYVGALRAGLTVVPANPAYTPAELERLVAVARPALTLLGDEVSLAALPSPVDAPLDTAAPDDIALIIYTSGTTGAPKGAPLTHANLLASAHAVRAAWRWTPDDTLALSLPLFHMHGLGVGLHGTLVTGAAATLIPRFDPALIPGATMFFGVPTMYHRLAADPSVLRGLRLAVSGSAPLAADLHETIRRGSGQVVLERYGMTETAMLTSNPYDGQRRPGTVGFPLPGVSLRLAPDGEIQVRGPNVIAGYLDNPAATADAYTADGWFRTGDLGTIDDDGYLRINGRAKELIITGGYNVYPREVEELLRTHPGVADAAVVGAPSAQWGETVAAFIVPAGSTLSAGASSAGASSLVASLEELCAAELVAYKRPRQWLAVEAIPRNALGKILRAELVARLR